MRPARSKKTDAIAILLKSSFGGRRRSLWRLVLLLALFLGLAGLLALWLWPSAVPMQLIMAAPDVVALPEEPTKICAQLEAFKPEQRDLALAGCELYFQAAADLLGKAPTNRAGTASLQARFAGSADPIPLMVRYAGIKDRQRGAQADAKVFVWRPDSSLVVVDVDHVLAVQAGEALWETNNLDLRPQEGALGSLRAAAGNNKIVYLSPGSDTPFRYNKVHSWLSQTGRAGAEHFPAGPLLAPVCGDEPAWLENVLGSLGERFQGKRKAVAGREAEARALATAGFETYLIGRDHEAPEGIRVVPTWKELPWSGTAK
jgi:hypothetical protein